MRPPNYLAALLAALEDSPPAPGTVEHVDILHDGRCGIFRRRSCDCNPVIKRRIAATHPANNPSVIRAMQGAER